MEISLPQQTHSRRVLLATLAGLARPAHGLDLVLAELKPETKAAFDRYIRNREARMERERLRGPHFLWVDLQAERKAQINRAGVVVEAAVKGGTAPVPDGLVHDWIAATFIPNVSLERTLAFVRNYDDHKRHYGPEVIDSRLLARDGDHYRVYLRLFKKKIVSVVLNTEYDVTYFPAGAKRVHSRSYSRRIAEVEDAGTPGERELTPGKDHGFLWRLYSYWRFEERDAGVWMECEAISLSRGVPLLFSRLVTPIIRELPRESLEKTLLATRRALAAG